MQQPEGGETKYRYNAYSEVISITDALTNTTIYTYDSVGNLKNITDAKGSTITNTYNLNNELIKVEQPDGIYSDTDYDGLGRVLTATNTLGKATTYSYNDLSRRYTVRDPLLRPTQYLYDKSGQLTQIHDANNDDIVYSYDDAGHLFNINYTDPNTTDVWFTYYDTGLRHTMQDATGTSTYNYDSLDRLTGVIQGNGKQVNYGYDLANNITGITYPLDGTGQRRTSTRVYDDANRLWKVYNLDDNPIVPVVFGYDGNSNLKSILYPGGVPGSGGVQMAADYDGANRLISMTQSLNATKVYSVTYMRDEIGLLTDAVETTYDHSGDIGHHYEYDELNRLKIDQSSTSPGITNTVAYTYDAASQIKNIVNTPDSGPVVTTIYDYDDASQLESYLEQSGIQTTVSLTFTYSLLGNRSQVRNTLTGSTLNYTYDQASRLTRLQLTGQTTPWTYGYDGDGLRMSKTGPNAWNEQFTWDLASGLPLLLQDNANGYLYGPGGIPIAQAADAGESSFAPQSPVENLWEKLLAKKNSPSDSRYPQRPVTPSPTSASATTPIPDRKGQTQTPESPEFISHFYYHLDQLGNVRYMTNDIGGVSAFYSYGAYGSRTCDGSCTDIPRFGYAGQYTDPESGMQYLRARYYDQGTQQFISRDQASGQPYVYAGGNPVNAVDPSGNFPWLALGFAALAIGTSVAVDVGSDFVFNNADFDFWESVGSSLGDPGTYLALVPGPGEISVVLRATGKGAAKALGVRAGRRIASKVGENVFVRPSHIRTTSKRAAAALNRATHDGILSCGKCGRNIEGTELRGTREYVKADYNHTKQWETEIVPTLPPDMTRSAVLETFNDPGNLDAWCASCNRQLNQRR